jgi:antitoxin HicB
MSWYEVELDADDNDTFLVTSPVFPEVATFGDNLKESLVNARRALEEAIAARIAHGDEIPLPSPDGKGWKYAVEMPMLVILKAGLHMACKGQGITRAELSRRLGWHREQVDRLFRLEHRSRTDQIEEAFRAIGIGLTNPVPGFSRAA